MSGWLALVGVVLFIAVGFIWRAWLQRRRFGGSGVMLFRSGDWRQHVREAMLLGLGVLLIGQAVAHLGDAVTLEASRGLPGGMGRAWLGAASMLGGTILMVVAQLDMGVSWRVGIDTDARPGLVVGGLYRLSRNPIYVAVVVVLAGYALLIPTWLSGVMLVGTAVALHNQARSEEAFLLGAYGSAYAAYAARVGRFLPGIGRLRSAA